MTLRAMVVDDEPLAVERMCALLARIPELTVVATAECGEDATPEELRNEIKRLRRELRRAELERDILKKATAYFAKESQ